MRRWIACAISSSVLALAVTTQARADDLERAYTARVRAQAHGIGPARADGWTYAYDSAELLRFAAVDRDLTRYVMLRDAIVARFVVPPTAPDAEARGDVVWRVRNGTPDEASGTTEALALADALLLGADAFARPEDRALARTICRAYLRHATVERDVWYVRNYYNLVAHAYATNSYAVDLLPDVLAAAGESDGARRSAEVLDRAIGPTGLFAELIQPEVETALPGAGLVFFSPNAVSSVTNSCNVALAAAGIRPALARRVLAFGVAHAPTLVRFYDVRDGRPRGGGNAGTPAFACFTRLAVRLADDHARRAFEPALRANAQTQLRDDSAGPDTATAVVFALRRSDAVR